MSSPIEIYTDGSCLGNPGVGGWAALLLWNGHEKKISGNTPDTTNNRMELTAVIEALKHIKNNTHAIIVYTDSTYVRNGVEEWLQNWKKNHFKNKKKQAHQKPKIYGLNVMGYFKILR